MVFLCKIGIHKWEYKISSRMEDVITRRCKHCGGSQHYFLDKDRYRVCQRWWPPTSTYMKISEKDWDSLDKKVCYISGHLYLSEEEFDSYYKLKIRDSIERGHDFVVGDASGADTMAQEYLVNIPDRVTVYHMFSSPRHNVGKFRTRGGFINDEERDWNVTKDSDYDILWIRPGREMSGTAQNFMRRKMYRS